MAETFPKIEPESLRQGDTVKWARTVTHLGESRTPGDGWTLTYVFVKENVNLEVSSTTDHGGGAFEVVIAATTSVDYEPGVYAWQAKVSKSGEVFTISEGRLEVLAEFSQATRGTESRSWAERTLSAVEALLEDRATKDQESYTIAGRSLTRMSVTELMTWRNQLQKRVDSERRSRQAKAGRDTGATIRLRM